MAVDYDDSALYSFPRLAAITKDLRLGGLNNKGLLAPGFGGRKSGMSLSRAVLFLKALGTNLSSLLPAAGGFWQSLACGSIPPVFTLCFPVYVCLCIQFFSSL